MVLYNIGKTGLRRLARAYRHANPEQFQWWPETFVVRQLDWFTITAIAKKMGVAPHELEAIPADMLALYAVALDVK